MTITKEQLSGFAIIASLLGMVISGAMWISSLSAQVQFQNEQIQQMRTERINKIEDELKLLRNDMQGARVEVLTWMNAHSGRR